MFLLVLACLSGTYSPSSVSATRLRDNSNVLVPNNDVNLKARIKSAFNGDVDPVDFQEIRIDKIKEEVKNPKIEKLIVDQLERSKNVEYEENEQMNVMLENDDEFYNYTSSTNSYENLTTSYYETTLFNFTFATPTEYNFTDNVTYPYNVTEGDTSTSSIPFYNEIHENQCILSDFNEIKPNWFDKEGRLNVDVIKANDGSVEMLDLSRKFDSSHEYEEFIRDKEKNYQVKYFFQFSLKYSVFI